MPPAIILHDDPRIRAQLVPFSDTRAIADIRVGILTLREKWEHRLCHPVGINTAAYLQARYPTEAYADECIFVASHLLPTDSLVEAVLQLRKGEALYQGDLLLAWYGRGTAAGQSSRIIFEAPLPALNYPWHIFQLNDQALRADYQLLTKERRSAAVMAVNQLIGEENIFIEEGAVIHYSILNAAGGPVYIGKHAQVMEGCLIRGPFSLGEGAVLKMGSKVYGATTIGPHCVVGGEVKNTVFFGHSNKAHDGYIGDAVIGEWCNLGAGTTCSNVKNNAGDIHVQLTANGDLYNVGSKCGLMMGDYSRTAINTAINSGTVIGTSCNIFGQGFPPKWVPSFRWGIHQQKKYELDKALRDAAAWMQLKGKKLDQETIAILRHLHAMAE